MPPPPRLPLSVLERILHFALGGDLPLATPATAADAMTPPLSTSHLLRVSKGVRELALPLYWRSITILRSDDWVKLWHPRTGLLAGERGQVRASSVKEIKVNVACRAALPISLSVIDGAPYEDDDQRGLRGDTLIDLAAVALPKLRHVCFFASSRAAKHDTSRGRVGPGDDEWLTEVQRYWEERREERLEEYTNDSSEEVFGEEEYDDDALYNADQTDREEQLRDQRLDLMSNLIPISSNLETIRTLIDQMPLSLIAQNSPPITPGASSYRLPSGSRPLPRIAVYPRGSNGCKSLSKVKLDGNASYDFVGAPKDTRPSIAAELVKKYTSAVVKRWRWVNEDGTSVAVKR